MDLGEFLICKVIAMQDLSMVDGVLSISVVVLKDGATCLLLFISGEVVEASFRVFIVDSESKCEELVLNAQQTATVIDIVTWAIEIGASLDGTHGHIQKETLVGELDDLTVIMNQVFLIFVFIRLHHSSKNHDFLAGNLESSGVHDSKLEVVSNVVYCLPNILLNIESFYCFDKIEKHLVANSGLWLKAFTSKNEDVFLVELTNTEGLSGLLKVRKHDPLLAGDGKELTRVETLDEGLATCLFFSIGHSSKYVNVVLEFKDNMVGSWVKHIVEWFQQRSVFVQIIGLIQELFGMSVVPTNHEKVSLGSHHISDVLWDVKLVLNHDCLCHVVQDFVRVDEFGLLLKVEDARKNTLLKAIFQLEIAREMDSIEFLEFFLHLL